MSGMTLLVRDRCMEIDPNAIKTCMHSYMLQQAWTNAYLTAAGHLSTPTMAPLRINWYFSIKMPYAMQLPYDRTKAMNTGAIMSGVAFLASKAGKKDAWILQHTILLV